MIRLTTQFGGNSIMSSGKEPVMDTFLKSLPSLKGKWLKVEIYYKIKQRSNKLIIDELSVTKSGRKT